MAWEAVIENEAVPVRAPVACIWLNEPDNAVTVPPLELISPDAVICLAKTSVVSIFCLFVPD
jgi:hypothetical protein